MNDGWPCAIGWDARPFEMRTWALLRAATLLVIARAALLTLGFQRTAAMAQRVSKPGRRRPHAEPAPAAPVSASAADPTLVPRTLYVIAMAAAFVPARLRCLERSIVLYYTLTRQAVPVTLRLGVRAYPFAAHAWVELEGHPINEIPDRLTDFDPIFQLG